MNDRESQSYTGQVTLSGFFIYGDRGLEIFNGSCMMGGRRPLTLWR
jgi:hypothetical protein